MKFNQPTTYADLDGGNAESLDSMEMLDSADSLSASYADLGKAFYEYRFEEPTPELLLYFDRITEWLKTNKDLKRQRNEHIEPISQKSSEASSRLNASNDDSFQSIPFHWDTTQQSNTSTQNAIDPWDQNQFNNFEKKPFAEKKPENVESNFYNQSYNQSILEQQPTFVTQSQKEKKKRGGFSPFRKKEKDRVSSFDELPNMEKGKFTPHNELNSSQNEYCPRCHNLVSPSDDFCGNCGTRLNH